MGVQITIRDVPEDVRDELASRAALQRKSMQEYLRGELERIASRPSLENWLHTVRERKDASGTRVAAATIISARDTDRR
jgi:plasmid stability protein